MNLPVDVQARLTRIVELFEAEGPQVLAMPLARPVTGKLWELRASGRDGIARCLYVLETGQTLVVLRVFTKKVQKTPRTEIELALNRWRKNK